MVEDDPKRLASSTDKAALVTGYPGSSSQGSLTTG